MSGHSKWASIKRKKGANDAKRGAMFAKLLRGIESAAREAGTSNPDNNMTLAAAVDRAKQASVPNDNIDRACKRGGGESGGANYERVVYEGYGPGGAAILVETLTDNRNRTGQDIRAVFARGGGNLGEPGSVSWMFERKGVFSVSGSASEDDVLLAAADAGAQDASHDGDVWEITCEYADFAAVKAALVAAGLQVESADLTMLPTTKVELSAEKARGALKLMDVLEDLDDVQDVHANFDIPEEILAEVS